MNDRAPTCGNRMNAHHWCSHTHAGHLGFETALEFARIVTDVGRGAAHVKPDDMFKSGQSSRTCHPHNTSRGPRKDGILTLEGHRFCKTTRRLHKVQGHTRHFTRYLLHE